MTGHSLRRATDGRATRQQAAGAVAHDDALRAAGLLPKED